jgi:6,7-dimethyl-8-ribityllumazine synthase
MSRHGAPGTTPNTVDGSGVRVAIVAGSWHEEISNGLIDGAQRFLDDCGAPWQLIRVPGSFELPVVAKKALESGFDAVVALGVIIRGGTPHFDYVAHAATQGLTDVALATGKPVGFGVLTLDTEEQGIDRAGFPHSTEDKGAEAADAAVRTVLTLRAVGQ